ncbi:cytidylyltransferase domain-containing protein [Poseidonibacter ostreae]|uniref:Acylneuraminate cytidylyltransferase n=1 Tax=Poseidonibacter ostreae TaxID=2654171 RepID=A0A6L4WUD8_9BACT|nr:hypothetical protein [Poseidonibacter ostreae]KAB7889778.1 hypothetical protein GBG19_05195 [Poseidonibacter ostreae]
MENNYIQDTVICIQARMSSSRFPGKILVDINGEPLIVYLYKRIIKSVKNVSVVVLTSNEKSDDPLVDVLEKNNIKYFRGDLVNVLYRFYEYSNTLNNNIKFIGRICADSPFINTDIIKTVINNKSVEFDIITTRYYEKDVLKSTASKGNNFDLLNRDTLVDIVDNKENLSLDDKEHTIFPFLRRKVLSIDVSSLVENSMDIAIDTREDLERLKEEFKCKMFI